MKKTSIPEYLLREIWKDPANFLVPELRLTDGSIVRVIDAGIENEHRGGPDFLGAKISIEEILISGDVELHVTPEHWHMHKHGDDARYSEVVLHVVLEMDEVDEDATGHSKHEHSLSIPTLVLRDNLVFDRRDLWEKLFEKVYDRSPELACFPNNLRVPMSFKRKVLEKFGEARLDELVDRLLIDTTTSE